MANKNKSKGIYHEKRICEWLDKIGVGRKLVAEVKYRDKSNFPSPFTVLEGRDIAFYKRKTGKPQSLVIMPAELFEHLFGDREDEHTEQTNQSTP